MILNQTPQLTVSAVAADRQRRAAAAEQAWRRGRRLYLASMVTMAACLVVLCAYIAELIKVPARARALGLPGPDAALPSCWWDVSLIAMFAAGVLLFVGGYRTQRAA